jgi:cytochrome c oxidase subunit 2
MMKALGFQEPASAIMEGIIELHNNVMFYLIVIVVVVAWVLYSLVEEYSEDLYKIERRIEILDTIGITHGRLLEIIWTITPSIILVGIAIPSFGLLYAMDELITPNITIKAIGHQWYWSYEYTEKGEEGVSFDSYMVPEEDLIEGELRLLTVDKQVWVPMNVNVRVIVTATDVLHSWAVPALGVKMDAVPGRLNQIGMYIKREGTFNGQCSEICGVNHAFMPIQIRSYNLSEMSIGGLLMITRGKLYEYRKGIIFTLGIVLTIICGILYLELYTNIIPPEIGDYFMDFLRQETPAEEAARLERERRKRIFAESDRSIKKARDFWEWKQKMAKMTADANAAANAAADTSTASTADKAKDVNTINIGGRKVRVAMTQAEVNTVIILTGVAAVGACLVIIVKLITGGGK